MDRAIVAGLVLGLLAGCGPVPRTPRTDPTSPAIETVEERWPNGTLRERRHVLRLPDGALLDDGRFERWYESGQLEYEAVFVHGKKEGTTIRYHRNGRKAMEQEYKDGERNGTSTTWDESGAKVKEEHWTDGMPDGTWTIWEDGKIRWQHTFDRGRPEP